MARNVFEGRGAASATEVVNTPSGTIDTPEFNSGRYEIHSPVELDASYWSLVNAMGEFVAREQWHSILVAEEPFALVTPLGYGHRPTPEQRTDEGFWLKSLKNLPKALQHTREVDIYGLLHTQSGIIRLMAKPLGTKASRPIPITFGRSATMRTTIIQDEAARATGVLAQEISDQAQTEPEGNEPYTLRLAAARLVRISRCASSIGALIPLSTALDRAAHHTRITDLE